MKTKEIVLENVTHWNMDGRRLIVEYQEMEDCLPPKEGWTPKIGEVVKASAPIFFIYSGHNGRCHTGFGNLYLGSSGIKKGSGNMCDEVAPTTHADRCEFFEALNAAGYKWNAKKLLLTKKEEKKWEPKEGDICTTLRNSVFIFKESINGSASVYASVLREGEVSMGDRNFAFIDNITGLATKSEKATLLAAMKKAGKQWNAEKKQVEDIPCPPKIGLKRTIGEMYWFLDSVGSTSCSCDRLDAEDDRRFEIGNYFHYPAEAMKFFDKEIKPVYKKRK